MGEGELEFVIWVKSNKLLGLFLTLNYELLGEAPSNKAFRSLLFVVFIFLFSL